MEINLNEFELEDLLKFQRKTPLFDPNDTKFLKQKEKEFVKKILKKERIDQKLKKKEKKQLLNLIYDSICQRIEEGKDTILGNYHDPLDLRNQSKKNLRKLSETLKKDNSIEEMCLVVDGISMQILFETIQSKSSLKSLKIGEIEDDVGAYFLSKALESNDTLEELHFKNNDIYRSKKIKKSSSKFLFDLLKKNKYIKKIDFSQKIFLIMMNALFISTNTCKKIIV